jgi:hypothetical protein
MTFQIPGSVINAAEKAKASANAAAAALTPSYADMLTTIKSGSIFKDTAADLSALGNLGVDTSAIAASIDAAKATMSIDMAVANAAVAQKAKEAQAAGRALSAADMEAAMAPLSVLKNLKSTLANTMSSVASAAASAGSVLGAALPGGLPGALPNPADLINSVASAATAFSASVPSQTIPDPENPSGPEIPNPAYSAFAAIPGNLDKLSSISGLTSGAASAGLGLGLALGGFALAAAAGKSDILGSLKADAMLATLTKPMPAGLGAIASDNLNLSSIDPYAAIKAQEAPSTVVVEKTPDPVRPQGSASILSKNTRFPFPASENNRIWTYELKQLSEERDRLGEAFWKSVGSSLKASNEERQDAQSKWFDGLLGPEKAAIRAQSVAIKEAKPEASSWTEEEAKIRATSKANAEIVYASKEYIDNDKAMGKYNQFIDWYDLAYNNWIGANNRFKLPAELLTVISNYKS